MSLERSSNQPSPPRDERLQLPLALSLLREPLATQRLHISPLHKGICDEFLAAVAASRNSLEAWLPWAPHCRNYSGVRRYLEACEHDWQEQRAMRLGLFEKELGELIGAITLENISLHHRSADLGYWLREDATGQGLMTEGCEKILTYSFCDLNFHRLRCAAAEENEKSLQLIKNLGFLLEGKAREAEFLNGRWFSHQVFSLLEEDYQARTPHSKTKDNIAQSL
ncbi:MAG: GNAT family N-acetyltransferase [Polyangiaceae bacterium]|nr:GNAT family N-acetyltransferase [Polyangiaceae bacterium]